jgi:hypothetical protein
MTSRDVLGWRADPYDFSREIVKKELYQERDAVEKFH